MYSTIFYHHQSDRNVDALGRLSGTSVTSTSSQLQALRHARAVHRPHTGQRVIYSLAAESVARPVEALQGTPRVRLAEVGAISHEAFKSGDLLTELPPGAARVAYCQGPDCFHAPQTVDAIRGTGHANVKRLATGLPQ